MPFDIETGKTTVNFPDEEDYSSITTDYLRNKMKSDKSVVAITAGTPALTALLLMREKHSADSSLM